MVLTSTHNLCFQQKYENYQNFSSESFHFLVVKFSIYLNSRVFVMSWLDVVFPRLYTKIQPQHFLVLKKKIFKYFLPYMGMTSILFNAAEPFD